MSSCYGKDVSEMLSLVRYIIFKCQQRNFTHHNNNNCFEIVFKTHVTQICGHESNSYHLDTTRQHPAVADTVVEVDTTDSTGHTAAEHSQAGCKLLAVEHYKPQPYAQTLHDTRPSGMTA
nr:hypothetical protein [Tanacetum cinerariifolium]